jgi:hypothetical protein
VRLFIKPYIRENLNIRERLHWRLLSNILQEINNRMNQMTQKMLCFLTGLVFQLMWDKKPNKSKTIVDQIIIDSQYQQSNIVEMTWVQYLWVQITQNLGITVFSLMVEGRWIQIALLNIIRERVWGKTTSPSVFLEGMDENKWLKDFENYEERGKYNDNDKKTRELLRHIDSNCRRISKKSLNYEDENQLLKRLYYSAFKPQMALL